MRILLLTHTFNSLTQRLYVELSERGHELAVEFDINDEVTREAVALFEPDIILSPILKRAIPEDVWRRHTCIIIHPGIKGDRGPSSLDWAILRGEERWGVTAIQADAEMDAGDIWASAEFPMRAAAKSSIYRNEVTEAAVDVALRTLDRFRTGDFRPRPLDPTAPDVRGYRRPVMRQRERAIDWRHDDTETVLRKIRSADGVPGVLDELFGQPFYLYNAHPEIRLQGRPGRIIARRGGAVCRATTDGAVWIGHLREKPREHPTLKLPAVTVLRDRIAGVPELPVGLEPTVGETYQEISYRESGGVGCLYFEFYNGAMGTDACRRLLDAYRHALERDTRMIVLMGGSDFWSNGMDLNLIEAADSPADESWRNINAMDDLTRAIIKTDDRLTMAVIRGNAGAGGVFLALAADTVLARRGVVLNPHYKAMGNLYGSEYWTYLLPKRVGEKRAATLTRNRLPVGVDEALRSGLIDDVVEGDAEACEADVRHRAEAAVNAPDLPQWLEEKRQARARDEARKPLERYREEELERMRLNFYGFDPSYHVARYNFVFKVPHSRTPFHLATHRR